MDESNRKWKDPGAPRPSPAPVVAIQADPDSSELFKKALQELQESLGALSSSVTTLKGEVDLMGRQVDRLAVSMSYVMIAIVVLGAAALLGAAYLFFWVMPIIS